MRVAVLPAEIFNALHAVLNVALFGFLTSLTRLPTNINSLPFYNERFLFPPSTLELFECIPPCGLFASKLFSILHRKTTTGRWLYPISCNDWKNIVDIEYFLTAYTFIVGSTTPFPNVEQCCKISERPTAWRLRSTKCVRHLTFFFIFCTVLLTCYGSAFFKFGFYCAAINQRTERENGRTTRLRKFWPFWFHWSTNVMGLAVTKFVSFGVFLLLLWIIGIWRFE